MNKSEIETAKKIAASCEAILAYTDVVTNGVYMLEVVYVDGSSDVYDRLDSVKSWLRPRTENLTKSEIAAEFGRMGGLSKSPAKAAASRRNGKLGGRPRKESKIMLLTGNKRMR